MIELDSTQPPRPDEDNHPTLDDDIVVQGEVKLAVSAEEREQGELPDPDEARKIEGVPSLGTSSEDFPGSTEVRMDRYGSGRRGSGAGKAGG